MKLFLAMVAMGGDPVCRLSWFPAQGYLGVLPLMMGCLRAACRKTPFEMKTGQENPQA